MQFLVKEFSEDPTSAMEAATAGPVEILGEDGEAIFILSTPTELAQGPVTLSDTKIGSVFQEVEDRISPAAVAKLEGSTFMFTVADESFFADFNKTESPYITRVDADDQKADCQITVADAENWNGIVNHSISPTAAYMTGKIKIEGNMSLAMKLQTIIG
jgi:putative sterol carrier protein